MSAYETLRAAVASTGSVLRDIQRFPTVEVSRIDLAELLAEFDVLTKAGAAPNKYTAEFEEAWALYPSRPGASKAATFKAWKARLKAGATAVQMIEGATAYAAYCKAKGTEPEFIKQPATFYGPGEHYAGDWTVRRALAGTSSNLVAAALQNRRGGAPDDFQGVTIDV